MNIVCHNCSNLWSFEPPLSRRDACPKCENDAKVCLNCRFYDSSVYRECREPQASKVQDKDRSNFCGYFEPTTNHEAKDGGGAVRSQLDALFSGTKLADDSDPSLDLGIEGELKQFLDGKK